MDLDPADFTPPQGRSELDEWLRVREDQIAAQLAADVRALVAPALTAWASTVTAAGDPQPLDVLNEGWRKLVVNEYGEVFAGMYQAGALSAWIAAPGEPPNGEGWAAVVNDAAVTYQTTATNRIVGAADSLWNDVRYRTVLAVREGVTNEALKDEIEAVTGFVEQRADAIARTETMAAYNGGNYDGAVAMGEFGPAEKTWVATNDARTRESHAAVDNVTIPFGDTFTVGSTPMLRPHDPAAPAGEVVHCRCRLAVLYPGDTRPDGTVVGGDITGENVPDDVTPDEVEPPFDTTTHEGAERYFAEHLPARKLTADEQFVVKGYRGGDIESNKVARGETDHRLDQPAQSEGLTLKKAQADAWIKFVGEDLPYEAAPGGNVTWTASSRATMRDVAHRRIEVLDGLTNAHALEHDVTLFRGLMSRIDVEPGFVITDAGFASTSLERAVAEKFVRRSAGDATLLRIKAPAGTRGYPIGGKWEAEFLLRRNTSLRVVSTETRDGVLIVDCEVVP